MSLYCCITTEGIEHIMPVETSVPMLSELLVQGQTTIYRHASFLSSWCLFAIIYHLHAHLPVMG